MRPGVTVPEKAPEVLRALSNGQAPGAGLRLYVPKGLVVDLGLQRGTYFRARREPDGRIRLTPISVDVREAKRGAGPDALLPGDRIRLELDSREALALEACLALGDRSDRSLLRDIGKRVRRRMRIIGWPTPDRTDDALAGAA